MKFRVAMDSAGELQEAFKGKDEYRIVPLTLMIGDEEIIDDGTIDQTESTTAGRSMYTELQFRQNCPAPFRVL